MAPLLWNLLALLARYVHIVCATMLVGGTLFYEMVVPVAIEDLREERQLEVMARSRWMFRSIVWGSVAGILFSGLWQAARNWESYRRADAVVIVQMTGSGRELGREFRAPSQRPGWWWAAHVSTGLIAAIIAVFLTAGPRPPDSPVSWMRFNLIILLIVMFLATATRHVRQMALETDTNAEDAAMLRDGGG